MQKSKNDATTNSTTRVLEPASTSSPPPTTTAHGGVLPPCSACRHQRKKCTKNCVLAPFFPPEKLQDFQAVHRVFGVSNVTKMLKGLSTEEGKKAVDSLIWEANCRLNNPVLGPLAEFQRVSEELKFYKTQVLHLTNNIHHNVVQVPVTQGAVSYINKSAQQRLIGSRIIGDNNGINNDSILDYIGIDNTRMFNYGSLQSMDRVIKQERDEQGSLIHPQHQMMNEFSHYYQ